MLVSSDTPGKIIISGEHAVVYGAPVLAMAAHDFKTSIKLESISGNEINCVFKDLKIAQSIQINNLEKIVTAIATRYELYKNGDMEINNVLTGYFTLIYFIVFSFTKCHNLKLDNGLNLTIESNITIGAGMGSSAALIVGVIKVLMKIFKINMDENEIFNLALDAENLIHGNSSGIDVKIVMNEKILYTENKTVHFLKKFPFDYSLIYTNRPVSTTGECVDYVKKFFYLNKNLVNEFTNVTKLIYQSVALNDLQHFKQLIRLNNQLLVDLNVVPIKIQKFIKEIETSGGAAKITGAGSVKGDNAGYLIVFDDDNDKIKRFALKYIN